MPGVVLSRKKEFHTYGFLLHDPSACIITPYGDMGALRVRNHYTRFCRNVYLRGGWPAGGWLGDAAVQNTIDAEGPLVETLSTLKTAMRSITDTPEPASADFSIEDMPEAVHLEALEREGECLYFCPTFAAGAYTQLAQLPPRTVHVDDLEQWVAREDLPFALHDEVVLRKEAEKVLVGADGVRRLSSVSHARPGEGTDRGDVEPGEASGLQGPVRQSEQDGPLETEPE